tara:strand:+ start:14876 stop:15082 length:207 start_codon:yes stop_codon:yes gene_type:complete
MTTDEFRIEEMEISMQFYWDLESGNESAMGPDQSSSKWLIACFLTHTHPQQLWHFLYTFVYFTPFPGN